MISMVLLILIIGLIIAGIMMAQENTDPVWNAILYILGPLIYVIQSYICLWHFYDIDGDPLSEGRIIRFVFLMLLLAGYYYGCFLVRKDQ